ncbi:hypothetical protein NDU88_002377 [Pleurodeles waltl]|uniref:Uncharacterized protein n=1 Tax=Pleurodeles waltl TaxID=8319 RepID=A0AAV7U9K9_PLEWA|nr:hypothetical protein NDU88_002377 [Pleurodeles waltl]
MLRISWRLPPTTPADPADLPPERSGSTPLPAHCGLTIRLPMTPAGCLDTSKNLLQGPHTWCSTACIICSLFLSMHGHALRPLDCRIVM